MQYLKKKWLVLALLAGSGLGMGCGSPTTEEAPLTMASDSTSPMVVEESQPKAPQVELMPATLDTQLSVRVPKGWEIHEQADGKLMLISKQDVGNSSIEIEVFDLDVDTKKVAQSKLSFIAERQWHQPIDVTRGQSSIEQVQIDSGHAGIGFLRWSEQGYNILVTYFIQGAPVPLQQVVDSLELVEVKP